jgi:prepilin-type N-terminal cleavage/methylation domain-containing protein
MKNAFTLIEVIMSVIIDSIVVMGAMKLQDKNRMPLGIHSEGLSSSKNNL